MAQAQSIDAKGMLIEWFDIVGDSSDEGAIVDSIEHDRPQYSAQPGLRRKLLPLRVDADSGSVMSGGSYLFGTFADAAAHLAWTQSVHRVDGLLFHERPFVANWHGFLGVCVGACDFAALATSQAAKRVQIWQAPPGGDALAIAQAAWPALREQAGRVGLTSLWCGASPHHDQLAVLSVCARCSPAGEHDYEAWRWLQSAGHVTQPLEAQVALANVLDVCMWVFTIWQPPQGGRDTLGLWPNSPPLPAPAYFRPLE